MSKEEAVILFHTSSHALRAEKVLKEQGMTCKLVPVPRHLSSDCGSCLRILRSDQRTARRVIDAAGVEIAAIHAI